MRHGRKIASWRWYGDKVQVAEESKTELIVGVEGVDAIAGDGERLLAMVDSVEEHAEVKVAWVIRGTTKGSADNRVEYAERKTDLASPMGRPRDSEVDKSAFEVDEGDRG